MLAANVKIHPRPGAALRQRGKWELVNMIRLFASGGARSSEGWHWRQWSVMSGGSDVSGGGRGRMSERQQLGVSGASSRADAGMT